MARKRPREHGGQRVGIVPVDELGHRLAHDQAQRHVQQRLEPLLRHPLLNHHEPEQGGAADEAQVGPDEACADEPVHVVLEHGEGELGTRMTLVGAGLEEGAVGTHQSHLRAAEEALQEQTCPHQRETEGRVHTASWSAMGDRTTTSAIRRPSIFATTNRCSPHDTVSPLRGKRPSSWNTNPPSVW